MRKILGGIVTLIILYALYLLILLSIPYLQLKPGVAFLQSKQFIYRIDIWRISFYIHVFCSFILIACGLLQFNKWILKNKKKLHRTSGAVYLFVLFLLSGPTGLIMSFYANGGFWAQVGFISLSLTWLSVSFISYYYLRRKNYIKHGNFMLFSYALTLSAITLRFYAYLINVFNIDVHPVDAYIVLSYLSWIPNLVIAFVMIRFGFIKRRMGM